MLDRVQEAKEARWHKRASLHSSVTVDLFGGAGADADDPFTAALQLAQQPTTAEHVECEAPLGRRPRRRLGGQATWRRRRGRAACAPPLALLVARLACRHLWHLVEPLVLHLHAQTRAMWRLRMGTHGTG